MDVSRRLIYGILITVAVGSAVGRILSAQLVFEPSLHRDEKKGGDRRRLWPTARPADMPTFSSNDRSRWATVRALVDEGSYVIGRRERGMALATAVLSFASLAPLPAVTTAEVGYFVRTTKYSDQGIIFEDGWQSVDKVLRPDTFEFYSSKPPLLSTLIAALYWVLKSFLGWSLAPESPMYHPDAVVRAIVILVNAVPFLVYLQQLAQLVEDFGRTDWGRIFVVASAAFATLVTPFLITLNNHTIATFCVLFALVSVVEIWRRAPRRRGGCAAEPIPSPWQHHAAAGFFASFAVCNELPALSFAVGIFLLLLLWAPPRALLFFVGAALVPAAAFFVTNYAAVGQLRPAYSEFGGIWYEYEGSHWRPPLPGQTPRPGIDWARFHESRAAYIWHLLVGHHGWFSLTPLWLLAIVPMIGGVVFLHRNWRAATDPCAAVANKGLPWFLPTLAFGLSVVVMGFYASRGDRNYGGFTNGLRWLMWLSPLWLLCLLPSADRLGGSRLGRGLAYLCLGISALSANYSPWNPWRHPWLYDLLVALGWPGY
jgi:hypothetical protein